MNWFKYLMLLCIAASYVFTWQHEALIAVVLYALGIACAYQMEDK